MTLGERRKMGFCILLDAPNINDVNYIMRSISLIDGAVFSNVGTVDEEKVFADIDRLECSCEELADKFIKTMNFKGIITIYDHLVTKETGLYISGSSFLKGNPITRLAIVVYNDKDYDYTEIIQRILKERSCDDIRITASVSENGRKYYLATFDTLKIDERELYKQLASYTLEEVEICINRNNDFYYNELLIDGANKSFKPNNIKYKAVPVKKINYDYSGDDTSLDPNMW